MSKFKLFAWDTQNGLIEIGPLDDKKLPLGDNSHCFTSKESARQAYHNGSAFNLIGTNVPSGFPKTVSKTHLDSYDILINEVVSAK